MLKITTIEQDHLHRQEISPVRVHSLKYEEVAMIENGRGVMAAKLSKTTVKMTPPQEGKR